MTRKRAPELLVSLRALQTGGWPEEEDTSTKLWTLTNLCISLAERLFEVERAGRTLEKELIEMRKKVAP